MRPIIASDRQSVRAKPDLSPFRSFSRSPGLTDSFHKLHDAARVNSPPSTAWSPVKSTGQRLALESGFRFTHEEGTMGSRFIQKRLFVSILDIAALVVFALSMCSHTVDAAKG